MNDDILKGIEINSAGYGTISKLAMQDRRLHITAKAIYAYFNSYTGSGDCCFPTRAKICFDLGISNDTLGKYLKQLIDNGYIKVEQVKEKGRFSHNVYTIKGTISPCPKISDTEDFVHGNLDTNNNKDKINSNTNNNRVNKKVSKKAQSYDEIINGYTQNETLKTSLVEFVKMRSLNKRQPLTSHGLDLLLKKLDKLGQTDAQKIEIVDQSVMRGWAGFFAVNEGNKPKQDKPAEEPKVYAHPFDDGSDPEYTRRCLEAQKRRGW